MEEYIKEGLLALLPCYREDVGGTVVFTLQKSYLDRRETTWLMKKLASFYSINLQELRRQCGRLLNLKRYVSLPFSNGLVLLPVKTRQAAQPGETTVGYLNLLQVAEILPATVASPQQARPTASIPGPGPGGNGAVKRVTKTKDVLVAEPGNIYPVKRGFPKVSWKTNAPVPPPVAVAAEPIWLSWVQFKCGLRVKTLNTPETVQERLRQGRIVLQDYYRRQKQGTVFTGFNSQELLGQLPNCNCFLKDIFKSFLKINKN